ncbi:hypothetical protein DFJ58DRAFT_839639 [Suillus subalutaceus]|uniref:uncharacterized protein n=1 Tax=Suillus subalutaceus TaxID=48586 RepID=UPI001B8637D7|nr:uncharacterized protein DFJ58DRAFT_839639 [Suillus subalutaceus]KAG1861820.1 hypothetical protein DFJ58DRAFT_839639 [Suillus subalutaceus]
MTVSSNPTDESSHPSGLLAYDVLQNYQDFDSMMSDAKFTADTRTDFYDRSLTGRNCALVGVACSGIFSCSCIVGSIVILAKHGIYGVAVPNLINLETATLLQSQSSRLFLQREILTLALDLIVTLCTESIGFVHGISLRSALASESRLRFNTNLRLLTAASRWYNPNGALLNGISAVLLIISYSSVSLVVCLDDQYILSAEGIAFAGLPLLILGVALLLQVMISLSGIRAVKILTWSSSPFDLTAALVHHTQLTPVTLRCMRRVSDLDTGGGPAKPPETQPSAWHAHPSIRKVIVSLWVIVAACAGWAALVMYIWGKYAGKGFILPDALTIQTWSFLPNTLVTNYIGYDMPAVNLLAWILLYLNIAVVQGPLTLGLHCSELVANPFLHWMFGLSFTVSPGVNEGQLLGFSVIMLTAQIWNLCIALFIFACFFTFVALGRPRGPQPAAYGHVQTLANLVDEWSPVMWWGHKEDGIPYCHAGGVFICSQCYYSDTSEKGTSDHPLPDVKMDCVYAGFGAGSLVPVS